MKILSAKQIRAADQYTITNEPIASIDLMERASKAFTTWFTKEYDNSYSVAIVCGPGNNGGDGLAVARLLSRKNYSVSVYLFLVTSMCTPDFEANLERLKKQENVLIEEIGEGKAMPSFSTKTVVIDAILGSGLTRNVSGIVEQVIRQLNNLPCKRVSIDIPSGLFADRHSSGVAFRANHTLTFQFPKLAFMFPENYLAVGAWEVAPIGLHPTIVEQSETFFYTVDNALAKSLYRKRTKFSHKGVYGHALLIASSRGMVGAGLLASKACVKSGAGLVTAHIPGCAEGAFQSNLPEVMISLDGNSEVFTKLRNHDKYQAIGIGCGLGTNDISLLGFKNLVLNYKKPLVIDADALNLLAINHSLLGAIPKNSILTPHPKEFERLFGKTDNNFERNELQVEKAQELGVYIILKGAHTCIATPGGNSYYNTSGNPGMATAGSGDVLTGIITGLLASGYGSFSASILGVYLHGIAGDLALANESQESLIASDIIQNLGKAFKLISD